MPRSSLKNLVHGALYNATLMYEDNGFNPQGRVTNSFVEFDVITEPPSLLNPVSFSRFRTDASLRIKLTETGAPGTMLLTLTTAGQVGGKNAIPDLTARRYIRFSDAVHIEGTHTVNMTFLENLIAASTDVVSVSPSKNLVHDNIYLITLEYQDKLLNDIASVSTFNIIYDTFTEPALFRKPTENFPIRVDFGIEFELTENAELGTLKMVFIPTSRGATDGNKSRILTFSSAFETVGTHTIASMSHLSLAASKYGEIQSSVPDIDLVHGAVYDVKLTYIDLAGNVEYNTDTVKVNLAGSNVTSADATVVVIILLETQRVRSIEYSGQPGGDGSPAFVDLNANCIADIGTRFILSEYGTNIVEFQATAVLQVKANTLSIPSLFS
eukprot:Stramenopile-MAST_4_protein_913